MGGGGLRILGHKKWHVWTKDNIEKVMRDERIDREEKEKISKKQDLVELEAKVEKLKNVNNQPFSLFPNTEKESGNEEFEKEKKEYEHRVLKRKGTAPLALGESILATKSDTVSSGKQKAKPWYTYAKGDAPTTDQWGNLNNSLGKNKRKKITLNEDPLLKIPRKASKIVSKTRPHAKSHRFTEEVISTKVHKRSKKKKTSKMEKLRKERLAREKS